MNEEKIEEAQFAASLLLLVVSILKPHPFLKISIKICPGPVSKDCSPCPPISDTQVGLMKWMDMDSYRVLKSLASPQSFLMRYGLRKEHSVLMDLYIQIFIMVALVGTCIVTECGRRKSK